MLNETEELLASVKNQARLKQIQKSVRKVKLIKYRNIFIKIIIYGLILSILIFPVYTGTIIGTWINDFFVTIIKNINK